MRAIATTLLIAMWLVIPARAEEDPLAEIRRDARGIVETAEVDAEFDRAELRGNYVKALDRLENQLTEKGDLDLIIHIREEKKAVKDSGGTTSHEDEPLVELREKYEGALDSIDSRVDEARERAVELVKKRVRGVESELTRAGRVEEALELRKNARSVLLEISGGSAEVPFREDPRLTGSKGTSKLPPIKVPGDRPPKRDAPFDIEGRWLESLTVPLDRQRLREVVIIGDRAEKAWPVVVLSEGSTWVGSDQGRVELSAGKFIAERCHFEDLPLEADLACEYYFTECFFEDCLFRKGGVWYGSQQAGKFYFNRCLVTGSFAGALNVIDEGVRAEMTVFEDIEFPSMRYREKQPADYLSNPWLTLVNCRFVDCRIPASFLTLTRDCVFEDCTFEDDAEVPENEAEVVKPFEVVIYTKDCTSRIDDLPEKITLTERPAEDIAGAGIPTLGELERELDR